MGGECVVSWCVLVCWSEVGGGLSVYNCFCRIFCDSMFVVWVWSMCGGCSRFRGLCESEYFFIYKVCVVVV